MEGAVGVGPSTSSTHSRPVRSSSRFYYNTTTATTNGSSPTTFSGPVRRWEKKWVHVSPSLPSTLKHGKQSNAPTADKSSILLCKWTPLSAADADKSSPRRKFRYTPIAVFEDKKRLAAKRLVDSDKSGDMHQPIKKLAVESDDIYRMLDISHDHMGQHLEASKSILTPYSRRSHLNHGLCPENQNKGGQLNMMNLSGF